MFEKEAEEILNNHCDCELLSECMMGIRCRCSDFEEEKKLLLEGIELGYSKANEWHKVADGDLPPSLTHVLNEKGNKVMYDAQEHTWQEYSDYYEDYVEAEQPIAWCEVPTFKEV